ncbi:MAG: dethiobiotin synthase [Prevotellaceae bacterium]|jgi:dethiobiotin synthetase|nr:dethiobiotin synthase [Prevotellaceae bacterium]
MTGRIFFVTGIDTNVGKSYATGYLAREFASKGYSVITQKLIQTGNSGISEDIEIHRKIMGTELFPEDIDGTTCPVVLSYPASPHLAAQIDNVSIDLNRIKNATAVLQNRYDVTLIEGAGGIMTPLTDNCTTLDYIRDSKFSVFVVTSPKLGSINHTLLTLEMCRYAEIDVTGMIYNKFNVEDSLICESTAQYLKDYMKQYLHGCAWKEIR